MKLGMNLGDNKGKKIAEESPFFEKNSHFAQIWHNMPKMAIFGQNHNFWDIAKKTAPTNFLKLH